MKFLKSLDWMLVFLISLIVACVAFGIYAIWEQYHWRTLSDGRIYRLNHTCISSHIENQYVPQTSISPNGQVSTVMLWQAVEVCDLEIVDTVWKKH